MVRLGWKRVLAALLSQNAVRLEVMESGFDVINRIESGMSPDLIQMDCQMPIMDSFEATRRIRWRELETNESISDARGFRYLGIQ